MRTIPWNLIDDVLEGKRLKQSEVKNLYKNYDLFAKAIGLEGKRFPSSSIVLTLTARTRLSTNEEQKICVLLRKMNHALERLEENYPDLSKIWDLAIMKGETYIDTAIMTGMGSDNVNTMWSRVFIKIKKAAFLLAGFLQ